MKPGKEEEEWRVCIQTEEEKTRILESYHGGLDGTTMANYHCHALARLLLCN